MQRALHVLFKTKFEKVKNVFNFRGAWT